MTDDDRSVGTSIRVLCPHCDARTSGRIEGTLRTDDVEDDGFVNELVLLQLVRCSHCGQGMLVADYNYGFGWEMELPTTLWPSTSSELSHLVPDRLRRAHEEARLCFSAKAYAATVVMVRRTLEGVCADQGTTAKILMKALEELRDSGKIEGRLFDWAQALRVLGNQGAHFTDVEVRRDDAEDALALSEALLDYIYVLAVRYEEFAKRRQLNSASSQGAQPS
ncbi:DUF4145 domain-containing protein [Streptomyces sp. NPDC005017]|uniref:DUF4145 domain-containing protein n=1 Tax=Streptomyces sp. NPDC005017 TaxID=3364706 RepID=UPI0036A2CDDE